MHPQYLIRIDDICPTMNWSVWRPVEEILSVLEVKPILAVVPDNQDETLKHSEPNVHFWDEVRGWQARGWTIGLHGYQHRYVTRDAGLLGIRASSEFSGLSYAEQHSKLQSALHIFEREDVVPEIWVAPAHSFDRMTLEILFALGVRCLSDGFSLYPYLDSRAMVWIPQQLWHLRKMPLGLWTVCLHLNHWTTVDVDRFRSDLRQFVGLVSDFRSIMATYSNRKPSLADAFFARSYQVALKGRRWVRSLNSARAVSLC